MQADPADLIRAILADYSLEAANINHPAPTDWDEFAVVYSFYDDVYSIDITGFAYVGNDFIGFFMPKSTKASREAEAYREAMTSDNGEKPVSFAVQFNRDSGRFKTLFEFDDRERWNSSARRHVIRSELRPDLG